MLKVARWTWEEGILKIRFLVILLAVAPAAGFGCRRVPPRDGPAPEPPPAYLIEWCWGDHNRPEYIVKHVDFIETRPFDGMVISDFAGRNLMHPDDAIRQGSRFWTHAQCRDSLQPLSPDTF